MITKYLGNIQNLTPVRKLVFGFVGASSAAIIGTAGFAAAQAGGNGNAHGQPDFVQFCKSLSYPNSQYKNLGDCISHNNGHGHGYGGN